MKTKQVESDIVPIPCSWEIHGTTLQWSAGSVVSIPNFLHEFIPLRNVHTYDNTQPAIGAGMYAVIESFEPVPHEFETQVPTTTMKPFLPMKYSQTTL
jgi:hypothetical protein